MMADQGITSYGVAKAAADMARGQMSQLVNAASTQGLRAGTEPEHQEFGQVVGTYLQKYKQGPRCDE